MMNLRLMPVLASLSLLTYGCGSVVVFDSPNSMRNIAGTIYLTNGRSYDGRLNINTEGGLNSTVKLIPNGESEAMRFPVSEVEGYKVRGDYYAMRDIRSGVILGRNTRFMKRITPADSRIHVYEYVERKTEKDRRNNDVVTYETNYLLELPNEKNREVWALNSNKFTPNFDEKMSKIVADCPSLAQKIANQEEGYFYRQVTVFKDKRVDVVMNIIDEYNKCGK
ncbi:hypothetical protein [Aridibaculum aurantiacum]|uniref:hypothetical protein n=1 Tax=Aridibaculum aurantiacum TaxID=2810307 RepID=UPI001A971441|nr:hypothetical protein [Aridibaculum aurantiacum]